MSKYDWMAGSYHPKIDSILKFFGLARYSVVKHISEQRWKDPIRIK